jgi:HSP20 family molecular chaperone IbpA
MSHHFGTFGPHQHGQHIGWGVTGIHPQTTLHPGTILHHGGHWNPSTIWQAAPTVHPGAAYLGGQWNPNTPFGGPLGWNTSTPGQVSIVLSPAYGTGNQEIAQTSHTHGAQIGFVPSHLGTTGGSFIPGTPGIPAGTIFSPIHGGHGISGGINHSFATELAENSHEYVISFDVPGINIEDLDVSLAGSTIWINGIRKGSNEPLAYSEIARGTISRAIGVPFDVTTNKAINTSLENGVLKIRISKDGQSEKKVGSRKVKIG